MKKWSTLKKNANKTVSLLNKDKKWLGNYLSDGDRGFFISKIRFFLFNEALTNMPEEKIVYITNEQFNKEAEKWGQFFPQSEFTTQFVCPDIETLKELKKEAAQSLTRCKTDFGEVFCTKLEKKKSPIISFRFDENKVASFNLDYLIDILTLFPDIKYLWYNPRKRALRANSQYGYTVLMGMNI